MHALGVDFSEIEAELARRHHKRNNFKGERQNRTVVKQVLTEI